LPSTRKKYRLAFMGSPCRRVSHLRPVELRQLDRLAQTGEQVVLAKYLLERREARLARAMPRCNALYSPLIAQCLCNPLDLRLLGEHEMQTTKDAQHA